MSLATRCPSCGTVFRVVQDQLKVSEGWVRCGRCGEAFNALEAMVPWPPTPLVAAAESRADPEADRSPNADAAAETAEAAGLMAPADIVLAASDGAMAPQAAQAAQAAQALGDAIAVSGETIEEPLAESIDEPPDAPADILLGRPDDAALPASDAASDAGAERSGAEPAEEPAAAETSEPAAAPAASAASTPRPARARRRREPQAAPSFVQQADRAARWQRPGVRAALALALLLATLLLGGQATHAFRDRLAASVPAARPLLLQACAALGCRIADYRQIDALTVESSGLTRLEGAPVYRLALTLHNRAAMEVAAPALDLAVTDAQGRPIARRVLTMADLGLPLRTLRPGREVPITASLAIDGQVSGYTVEIFHP